MPATPPLTPPPRTPRTPSPPPDSPAAAATRAPWRSLLGWDALVLVLAVAALLAPLACRLAQARPYSETAVPAEPAETAEFAGQPSPPPDSQGSHPGHDPQGMAGMPGMGGDSPEHVQSNQQGATASMSHQHMGMGTHMKMTALRPSSPEDERRAAEIVRVLRRALDKYRDYRVAIADGYQPFLPNLPQPIVHFTNWTHGLQEAFSFDPERPTSLLYEKTADGYRLHGAMFTTPKGMSEEELDSRVPLSVTSWHQHVNICLPRKGQGRTADWTKLGFAGSIATAPACAAAGGDFHPVIFGWMVHVYPFETDPARIWAH
jgi:hypothetical protein